MWASLRVWALTARTGSAGLFNLPLTPSNIELGGMFVSTSAKVFSATLLLGCLPYPGAHGQRVSDEVEDLTSPQASELMGTVMAPGSQKDTKKQCKPIQP